MMMALTALSVDLVLPAFDDIRNEFGLASDSAETAGIITAFLLGLAVPQLIYGPLADRYGRKPLLYAGFALFAVGTIISATASSLDMILIGRFIWGLGAAGPRVVAVSIIRDTYEGERMARVMSFIMTVFILVPIVAPSIGA
jgi:DHA1 family bicyclomycin/chloramphenicol resistance-like MFS transporter